MKILYAIQGTGNGHLSRALDVIPCLQKRAEVDVLISGIQADLELPFPVKYKLHGLSFIFGKHGGIDLWKTFLKSKTRRLVFEIVNLPVQDYDIVISDFEPVSAWACNFREKDCIGLSHQIAALDARAPKPKELDLIGRFILKNYAPPTTGYGFHFRSYSARIFTPVIRQQIRQIETSDQAHYTVYLPAYSDHVLIKRLSKFQDVQWEVFSKHNKTPFSQGNIRIQPISNEAFIRSMANCTGVLCGAGFETPAEALFLNKKLLVVPMRNQYEQQLNATSLKQMGVTVVKNLKRDNIPIVEKWLKYGKVVSVDYPDRTQEIVDLLLK